MSFGLIGFADDYAKVAKQTTAGVSGRVRLILGFIIAGIAAYFATISHPETLQNQLALPVLKDVLVNLGFVFIPFAMIVIVGAANAVNLTDGLDGLAIMPVMIAGGTLGVISYAVGRVDFTEYLDVHYVPGTGELYFKKTGKRVFLMAPIHHHYEKKGWSEPQIVIRFWIISLILAIIGLATLKVR